MPKKKKSGLRIRTATGFGGTRMVVKFNAATGMVTTRQEAVRRAFGDAARMVRPRPNRTQESFRRAYLHCLAEHKVRKKRPKARPVICVDCGYEWTSRAKAPPCTKCGSSRVMLVKKKTPIPPPEPIDKEATILALDKALQARRNNPRLRGP